MRKLAILAITLLVGLVVVVTLAAINYGGVRDTLYNGIQGTILQPAHDWAVNTWFAIGNLGFTYIAAATLGIMIFGGLFMTVIVYGLVWQRLIQQKLLHKTAETVAPLASMQRTTSTELPVAAPPKPQTETAKEEG